eukprot:10843-Heterococcus_DN1.PRE.2
MQQVHLSPLSSVDTCLLCILPDFVHDAVVVVTLSALHVLSTTTATANKQYCHCTATATAA